MRLDLGEEPCKVTHTIVSDDQHALEILQSRHWPYFINRLLEVSDGSISSFSLAGIGQNQNNIEELEIIDDTYENLEKYENCYADILPNVRGCFQS